FHLLSSSDLTNVHRANAHFSDDVLSSLLNEPITGQGVFWSGVGGMPFPIYLRVMSFGRLYPTLDPNYDKQSIQTYAAALRTRYAVDLTVERTARESGPDADARIIPQGPTDPFRENQKRAIDALARNESFLRSIESNGIP